MKDAVVQEMVKRGVPQAKAEGHWNTVCAKLNDGDPLTQDGLAVLGDAQIQATLPPVAAAALIAFRDGQKSIEKEGEKKGKKFKPGRSYTAEEYADFYGRTPDNADLVTAISAATDGKPWVVYTNRYHVAQSAKFIQWHMDEEIAPPTIDVGGVPVAPVFPGEEKTPKEAYIDPFDTGAFLDVEMGSRRTGASFKGYVKNGDDSALSAMQFLYVRALRGEGNLSLLRLANENRDKTAVEILAQFPTVLAEWSRTKPEDRPKTKAPRRPAVPANPPPAGAANPAPAASPPPVAASSGAVRLCVYGTTGRNAARWGELKKHLAFLVRTGRISLYGEENVFAGENRKVEMARARDQSDAVLVLVGADTLAEGEYENFLRDYDKLVIPVIMESCSWQSDPFLGRKVPLPRDGKGMGSGDQIAQVATEIGTIVNGLRK